MNIWSSETRVTYNLARKGTFNNHSLQIQSFRQ